MATAPPAIDHRRLLPDDAPATGPASYVRWRILALLTLASFVAYVLRTNVSVAGERMMRDLGLTQVQLGVVLAAFAWGYAIFQIPGGIFGEWSGGRKGLTVVVLLWGVLNLLVGAVPGISAAAIIVMLATLRFLMGAAQAPLFPILSGESIARWFPITAWALPNAITNAGLTLGSAATAPLIAWLTGALGWRGSFLVTSPLAFLVAGWWWWYARDLPEQHPAVTARELAIINQERSATADGAPPRRELGLILRDRNLLLLTASYFCANYVFYFFFNWLFIYLVDVRKLQGLAGGALAAISWSAGAAGAAAGGVVCDWLSRRYGFRWGTRAVSIAGLTLSGGFLVAAAVAASPGPAVVFLSLCLAFEQFTDSAAWATAMRVGGRYACTACGVLNTGGNVVGGFGALLVPLTARELGWPAALATGSLFAIVGALLWIWIRADQQIDEPGPLRRLQQPA